MRRINRLTIMKRLMQAIGIGLLIGGLSACASWPGGSKASAVKPAPDKVIMLVNGEAVRQAELEHKIKELAARAPDHLNRIQIRRMRASIVYLAREALITEKAISQAARRQGIVVTAGQIEAERAMMDDLFKSNGSSLAEYIQVTGTTPPQLREEIRQQVEQGALLDKLLGLKPPTAKEIRDYYDHHQERYTVPSAVRVSEILVAFPQNHQPTSQERQALREKTEVLRRRLLKGENFATLARAVSNGPTAKEGGDLGWVPQDAPIPKPLLKAIFEQEVGHVGPVIEYGEGCRMLLVTDWSKAQVAPFDSIRPIVERDLLQARRADKAPILLKKIRKEAKVVEL